MLRRNRRQHDLDCQVALATGEDLRIIRRHGFSVIDLEGDATDPGPDTRAPLILDWDALDDSVSQLPARERQRVPA